VVTKDDRAVPLASVVGMNARKLRGDATADDLATAARHSGLNWGTGRISDLEHGRVSPTVPTLVALAAALGDVRGEPVTLADLVEHDGMIELTKDAWLPGKVLQRFLRGEAVEVQQRDVAESLAAATEAYRAKIETLPPALQRGVKWGDIATVTREAGETEDRIAKALGVETWVVNRASAKLWKQTVSAERDRRAGPDATKQARGRITRELREELRAAIHGND
jgi:transcriptional regulator with XRE-family HTH domain